MNRKENRVFKRRLKQNYFCLKKEREFLSTKNSYICLVDWHPTMGLIASGSRDSQQPVKIWDPKTGKLPKGYSFSSFIFLGNCLATL